MKRLACTWFAAGWLAVLVASPAGAADERYPSDEALRHYLQGRWLEEVGSLPEAGAELSHAAALDPSAVSILLHASEVASRTGESARALELAQQALARSPGNARAFWLEGAALFNLSRVEEAAVSLRDAVRADSTQAEYWRTLGHAAESLQRLALMDSCYDHVTQLDGDDAEAWFQLATTRARLGRLVEADSALSVSLAENPTRPGGLFLRGWIRERLGHPEEAAAYFEHHLESHPDDQATRRRLVALLDEMGRGREALAQARRVANADPRDASALSVLAELEYKQHQDVEGARTLARLRALAPDDGAPLARSAEVMVRNHHGPDAIRLVDAWMASHPRHPDALRMRGWVRAAAGQPDSAVAYARLEVAAAPDSTSPRRVLARYLREAHRWAEAAGELAALCSRVPDDASLRMDLGFCREQADDLPGAIQAGRDALALAPDSPQALNFLGYLLADHGRNLPEARTLIQRAVDQEPDNAAYIDSMGWVLFRLGQFDLARAQLERAVSLMGEDPVVHEHLGDVYRQLQMLEQARAQYRLSLAQDAANQRVRNKLNASR